MSWEKIEGCCACNNCKWKKYNRSDRNECYRSTGIL